MGVETELPFGREGGSASGRETPAVNKEWSGALRGPEDGRRVFVVLEAAWRELGSGGGSGGKGTLFALRKTLAAPAFCIARGGKGGPDRGVGRGRVGKKQAAIPWYPAIRRGRSGNRPCNPTQ